MSSSIRNAYSTILYCTYISITLPPLSPGTRVYVDVVLRAGVEPGGETLVRRELVEVGLRAIYKNKISGAIGCVATAVMYIYIHTYICMYACTHLVHVCSLQITLVAQQHHGKFFAIGQLHLVVYFAFPLI